jgi:hypothetical protein
MRPAAKAAASLTVDFIDFLPLVFYGSGVPGFRFPAVGHFRRAARCSSAKPSPHKAKRTITQVLKLLIPKIVPAGGRRMNSRHLS